VARAEDSRIGEILDFRESLRFEATLLAATSRDDAGHTART
jgi:hypothetical protein